VEHHAEVLTGGVWRQRAGGWRDLVAVVLVVTVIILVGTGARQMVAPLVAGRRSRLAVRLWASRSKPLRRIASVTATVGPRSSRGCTRSSVVRLQTASRSSRRDNAGKYVFHF